MSETLLDKVWRLHTVRELAHGQTQLFIGLHLIHEVTSPQAFAELKELNLRVRFPERTFGTVDHIIPTDSRSRPFADAVAEQMITALAAHCAEHNIKLFEAGGGQQGIVHVIAPELGLTQPGMTIVCGDSHTATHGAFGAIACGIGTSQVRDCLASQTLLMIKPKVRRIEITGKPPPRTFAKDLILAVIRKLGANGGKGFAYEYGGTTIEQMTMEERLTVCNMTIEGGARFGYVNPDAATFEYLKNRPFAPANFAKAVEFWRSICSDAAANYDEQVEIDAKAIAPQITWGINPAQSIGVDEAIPDARAISPASDERAAFDEALNYMRFRAGERLLGKKIDVVFIGSCTNSRISDLRVAAEIVKNKQVARNVRAIVVPGSETVARQAEMENLPEIFRQAGFDWRKPGCSMCVAMNQDRLRDGELCISTSNRNFKGRQGSATGRTILASPATAAAAAIAGEIVDVRKNI
jgi:3-isopropylmalate/(R)-2-methylmalate dehydratase large subunit